MLLVFIAFSVFFVQVSADSLEDNENDEEIPASEDKWLKEHKVEIFDVNFFRFYYRWDLQKQEGWGMVAHERLTEPRVKKFLKSPRFLDLNNTCFDLNYFEKQEILNL